MSSLLTESPVTIKQNPAAFDLIYNWADSAGWPELEKDVADGYYKGNY